MDASWHFVPKLLKEAEFKDALEQAVAAVLRGPVSQIVVAYPRRDGRPGVREDDIHSTVDSLRAIVDLSRIDLKVSIHPSERNGYRRLYMAFDAAHGVLNTYASGSESVECLEQMVVNLALDCTNPPTGESEGLELRVATLERAMLQSEQNLKCFISFKFEDTQTVEQISVLKRMLTALNIEWITGEQFEPRRIEDKVKTRLSQDGVTGSSAGPSPRQRGPGGYFGRCPRQA